jgi:thiol-disulfide isomerase/thioredoxin
VPGLVRATGALPLALAVALVASACGGANGKGEGAAPAVTKLGSAPLVDRTPAQFDRDVAALKGRVVVVNFWASWCAPCQQETPALERTAQSFAGKPVTFIGVDASDKRSDALGFLRKAGVTYPTVYDSKGIYGGIATHWQVASLPQTWLLAKDGARSLRIPRPVTQTELTARINQLLHAA